MILKINFKKVLIRKYSKLPGLLINKAYWQLLLKKDSGHQSEGGEYIIDKQIKKAYDKHRYFGSQPLLCYAPLKSLYFGILSWLGNGREKL